MYIYQPTYAPVRSARGVRRARLELRGELEDEPGEDAPDEVAGAGHEEGQADDPRAQVRVGLCGGWGWVYGWIGGLKQQWGTSAWWCGCMHAHLLHTYLLAHGEGQDGAEDGATDGLYVSRCMKTVVRTGT